MTPSMSYGEMFLSDEMPVTVAGNVPRAQLYPCPTCGDQLRGLLDSCLKSLCLAADIAFEYGPKAKRPEATR